MYRSDSHNITVIVNVMVILMLTLIAIVYHSDTEIQSQVQSYEI